MVMLKFYLQNKTILYYRSRDTSVVNKHKYNRKWFNLCKKVLKPNGTIWISETLHNIYLIGMALEQEGFKIINNITWKKTNTNLAMIILTEFPNTHTIIPTEPNTPLNDADHVGSFDF